MQKSAGKKIITVKVSLISFLSGIVLLPSGFIFIALSIQNDAFMFSGEPVKASLGGLFIAVGVLFWLTSSVTGLLLLFKHPIVLLWLMPLGVLIIMMILSLLP
jgi:hypothetical protein